MPRTPSQQLVLDLTEPTRAVSCAAREAAGFTPWPVERREREMGKAVAEAMTAMLHLAGDRAVAERLPRLLENAVLASASGPGGVALLAQVDEALVQACGRDHGLLDGRYA